MFKLLAFLVILVILFGVETTRALIFGAFGFIFWALIILVAIGLFIPSPMQKFERQKRQKEYEAKQKAERQRAETASRARHQASIAKQKAWFGKHPVARSLADFLQDHTGLAVALLTILSFAVMAIIIFAMTAAQK